MLLADPVKLESSQTMEPWLLIGIGAGLVVFARVWSWLATRASDRIVETISIYELGPKPGNAVPRMVVFLYVAGLAVLVAGLAWWVVDAL